MLAVLYYCSWCKSKLNDSMHSVQMQILWLYFYPKKTHTDPGTDILQWLPSEIHMVLTEWFLPIWFVSVHYTFIGGLRWCPFIIFIFRFAVFNLQTHCQWHRLLIKWSIVHETCWDLWCNLSLCLICKLNDWALHEKGFWLRGHICEIVNLFLGAK